MIRILSALAIVLRAFLTLGLTLLVPPAFAATTYAEGAWSLQSALGNQSASNLEDCKAKWRALPAPTRSRTDYCREQLVTRVTTDQPPPTCTSAQPAADVQAVHCPAGSNGMWTQTRTYTAAPYPTCWVPGPYLPATVPDGSCSATPPPTNNADADFIARCVGALVCEGFDDPARFKLISTDGATGLYPIYGTQKTQAVRDTTLKASGAASLRFDILTRTGDDPAGHYEQAFANHGPGTTFYVQWRQRFDTTFATYDWQKTGISGTNPKQIVIWDRSQPPCTALELTITRYWDTGAPIIYSNCGDKAAFGSQAGTWSQAGNIQQGDYTCSQDGGGTCLKYADLQNKWVTFYEVIKVGALGSANSSVQAYVATDGKPYKQWVNITNYTLDRGGGSAFNRVMLTPYMTGKSAAKDHPQAATWYDELIISDKPIAAPSN